MSVTTEQEHRYERRNIGRLRELYLATDVMVKVQNDPGYAEKVSLIEKALADTTDWILDVGANTCGESEYLTTRGYKIIANDIKRSGVGNLPRALRSFRPSIAEVLGV